jgi:hypothetical protein
MKTKRDINKILNENSKHCLSKIKKNLVQTLTAFEQELILIQIQNSILDTIIEVVKGTNETNTLK